MEIIAALTYLFSLTSQICTWNHLPLLDTMKADPGVFCLGFNSLIIMTPLVLLISFAKIVSVL